MNLGYGIDSTKIIQYIKIDSTDSYVFKLNVQSLSADLFKPEFDEQKRFEVLKMFGTAEIVFIGKIVNTEKIFLDGYQGVFAKGEITQNINQPPYPPVFIKTFLVGNRIYSLTVTCSFENKENPSIDKFFNSFELIKNK